MPGAPGQPPFSDAPLYIRWGADRSPYAIELKLELVGKLRRELLAAEASGMEIGGVLVGALPTPQSPTLRIEEVEILPRRAQDGATFMLEGGGSERFAEVRARARVRQRSAVGLFRSHIRPGPLRPSLPDRTLLAGEFKDPVYALLVVEAADPYAAAFFIASNGPLPSETSVREFKLDEADFQSLPELEPENPASGVDMYPSRSRWKTTAALLVIVIAVLGAFWFFNQSLFPAFPTPDESLRLAVVSRNHILHISWNHSTRDFDRATGATLIINAGGTSRDLRLGVDELRLGAIDCESKDTRAEIILAVNTPGSFPTSQSVVWSE